MRLAEEIAGRCKAETVEAFGNELDRHGRNLLVAAEGALRTDGFKTQSHGERLETYLERFFSALGANNNYEPHMKGLKAFYALSHGFLSLKSRTLEPTPFKSGGVPQTTNHGRYELAA